MAVLAMFSAGSVCHCESSFCLCGVHVVTTGYVLWPESHGYPALSCSSRLDGAGHKLSAS